MFISFQSFYFEILLRCWGWAPRPHPPARSWLCTCARVELVHELCAVIILGGRIELESEIDVRVTGPDTITKPALPPPLQVSAATALCVR